MAPTLVSAAVAAVLAAALLGAAFDRRAVAVVVAAAVFPDLDAVASLAVPGATNALFHALWLPLTAGVALYWDTAVAADSRLRARFGWRGVRVAWVALAAVLVAGIGSDLFGEAGANLLYPFHDAYYSNDGRLVFSTQEGIVQTFVALGAEGPGILPFQSHGTTASSPISTWVNPDGRPGFSLGADRDLSVVRSGWQLVIIAAGTTLLAVRFARARRSGESDADADRDRREVA
jgi:hypothetical protein